MFNLPSTFLQVEQHFKEVSLQTFDFEQYSQFLTRIKSKQLIFNSAYIMCANKAFGFNTKHENYLCLLHKIFVTDNITQKLTACKTFKDAFNIIVSYPLIGNFLAYQYTTDLNYSSHFNWQDSSVTVAASGSKRGIQKVFGKVRNYEEIIMQTYATQEEFLANACSTFRYINNHKLDPMT